MAEKRVEEKNEAGAEEDVIIVQNTIKISDGLHSGTISNIVREQRQGYDYIDIYIETEDDNEEKRTIKTGFPCYISENSALGIMLKNIGMDYKPDDKISISQIKDILINKEIQFQTYTEDKGKGTFARIINKTIKFL